MPPGCKRIVLRQSSKGHPKGEKNGIRSERAPKKKRK